MRSAGRNPRKRELREGDLLLGGNGFDLLQDSLVMLHGLHRRSGKHVQDEQTGKSDLFLEPIEGSTEVLLHDVVGVVDGARQQPSTQRPVRCRQHRSA